MKISEELKQKILEMCADHIGLTSIMAKELSITDKKMNEIMKEFVGEGLVTKEKEERDSYVSKHKDQYWCRLTEKGRKELI